MLGHGHADTREMYQQEDILSARRAGIDQDGNEMHWTGVWLLA